MMTTKMDLIYLIFLISFTPCVITSDITKSVFSLITDGMPAAFGDFNSDELTDVIVLRNDGKTVEILLAADEEPLLRPTNGLKCKFDNLMITSVVPGDFDGDAFMDLLVTAFDKSKEHKLTSVYIIWGELDHLTCPNESDPTIMMHGQPLAIDYNQDMIIDLFGIDKDKNRTFWVFNNNRTRPEVVEMNSVTRSKIRIPHSHAFLDRNNDNNADLFLTTTDNFEVWIKDEEAKKFIYHSSIPLPKSSILVGQSLFVDVELIGRMDLVTPICYDVACTNSSIMVFSGDVWHDLNVNFKDMDNTIWGFAQSGGKRYTDVITLRSGDFNMDGYPDILATLKSPQNDVQAFLLENVPCATKCGNFNRTYKVDWKALKPYNNNTVMAVFYDFYQDGILDLIFVHYNEKSLNPYKVSAFKNSLDYDANFIKVMVLTGLTNSKNKTITGNLGKKKRTYGTNLPGPIISYRTTTQEDKRQNAISAQLPQSAHFALYLPYNIFGLGRTPNFVDTLTVGLSGKSREWTQIIPNSQMVVIPWPPGMPSKWKAQLFVTPSKLILMSVLGLTVVCGLITLIIMILYWKEKQEDKKERLQESHRFHFDAM